jgi:hypothetical protein
MNKKIAIIFSILLLSLIATAFQYVEVLKSEIVKAYSVTKPANGHSWTEIECTSGLCIINDKVGIGTDSPSQKLEVNGSILASGAGDICNGAGKCLSSVFQTNSISGTNSVCPSGQSPIMKAIGGIWYTATAPQVATSWNQVACGAVVTSDGTPLLVNGIHTQQQCVSAGGTVVLATGSLNQCRFNAATCPSGWVHFNSWCTAISVTGGPGSYTDGCGTSSCTSLGHEWADAPVYPCTWCPHLTYNWAGCYCQSPASAVASITQIGCY